ncbi:hypothetical protein DYI20_02880 [Auritidibacter ignavus]|nr:alkyl hydroperoxide reductase subunit AhpF [Auritidibacter ignavus]RMX23778.1 hypothetical protein DYI20_02880 [Auritidibacter ignavus]
MDSGWLTLLITLLGGTGLGGTVAGIYSARASARTGQSGNEVEAAKAATANWDAFTTKILARVDALEAKVKHLEADRAVDAAWISLLQEHIWLGKPPPPPNRPPRDPR